MYLKGEARVRCGLVGRQTGTGAWSGSALPRERKRLVHVNCPSSCVDYRSSTLPNFDGRGTLLLCVPDAIGLRLLGSSIWGPCSIKHLCLIEDRIRTRNLYLYLWPTLFCISLESSKFFLPCFILQFTVYCFWFIKVQYWSTNSQLE